MMAGDPTACPDGSARKFQTDPLSFPKDTDAASCSFFLASGHLDWVVGSRGGDLPLEETANEQSAPQLCVKESSIYWILKDRVLKLIQNMATS
jgi:hypothetical protein